MLEQRAAKRVVMLAQASRERRRGQSDDRNVVVRSQQLRTSLSGHAVGLVNDDQANIIRQTANMHRVDGGNQHVSIMDTGVLSLKPWAIP